MLKDNYLLDKLKNSEEVCFGSWSIIPNPMLIEIISLTEIDFLIFDSEHSSWSIDQSIQCSMICESAKVSPILRVSDVQRGKISKALDSGLHGIQVPNIGSREEADQVINFSKFTPQGIRGFSPFTRASNYSSSNSESMIKKANSNTLVIVHVEDKRGINNIESILEQDLIDVVFLGLFDISVLLGLPGQIDHAEVQKKFVELSEKVISANKILGSIVTNKEQINFLTENKVRYLTYSADCQIISDTYKGVFNNLRG